MSFYVKKVTNPPFASYLQKAGLYAKSLLMINKQSYKQKILTLLNQHHFLSLAEISCLIPDADYSTLFRNIEKLCDSQQVKPIIVSHKVTVYELASHKHSHFICQKCQKVEEAEPLSISIKKSTYNDVTIRGLCDGCKK